MSSSTPTPTPTPAWIAATISMLTLPMAVYPLCLGLRLTKAQCDSTTRHKIGHHGRLLRFPVNIQRAVWGLAVVSHFGLILFAVMTALETECIGLPADFGYVELDLPCPKHQVRRAFTLLEILVAPIYPTASFLLYNSLDPKISRKMWKRNLSRSLVASVGCTTVALLVTAVGGLLITADPGNTSPSAIALVAFFKSWQPSIFNLWFVLMVGLGVTSLYLTIRLLPWLQRSGQTAQHPELVSLSFNPTESGVSTESTVPVSLPDTIGSAHQHPLTFSPPPLPVLTPRSTITSSLHSHNSATFKHLSPSDSQLDASIRRLKALLFTILAILTGNAVMVALNPFPFVLHAVIGWVSCRAISVLLYMSTGEIKTAAMSGQGVGSKSARAKGSKSELSVKGQRSVSGVGNVKGGR